MKRFLTIFAAAAALLVAGCQKAEVEDNLNIGSTTIVVSNAGATQDIVFTANTDWTIASDQAWVTFDREKGAAGKVTVTLTIAANETTDDRTAKVTVKAGSKETVFTIEQKAVTGFASSIEYKIDEKAQDITIGVAYNVDYTVTVGEDSPWLTVTKTKVAPQEGAIVIHAAANSQLGPRVGTFTIAGAGFEQVYSVVQSAAWTPAVKAEGKYISNSQDPTNHYYQQYVVDLVTEDDITARVVFNKNGFVYNEETYTYDGTSFATDKLVAGTYVVDDSNGNEDGTFSINPANSLVTSVIIGERVVSVIDGEVVVEETDGAYVITAALVDEAGNQYSYSYEGAITFEKDLFSGNSSLAWDGIYDTYYTTKNNRWSLQVYVPRDVAKENGLLYFSIRFFTSPGDVDLTKVPVGTYTFVTEKKDAEQLNASGKPYSNGASLASVGDISYVYVNNYDTSDYYEGKDGDKVVVSENEDGTYHASVTFDGDVTEVDFSIDEASDESRQPVPDGDCEFVSLEGPGGTDYMGYWLGNSIGSLYAPEVGVAVPLKDNENNEIPINFFSIGSNSDFNGAYNCMFTIIASPNWYFVANYANRFCNHEVPAATYTYSDTPEMNTLVPGRNGNASRCYLTNKYTGSTYYPVSGSITISSGKISLDLTAKTLSGNEAHFTGGTAFTCSYLQNWAAASRWKTQWIGSPFEYPARPTPPTP